MSTDKPRKIILDTDIGDDIDDAFALALALCSPELELIGVTAAYANTEARARIACRMLYEAGRADIPVAVGRGSDSHPCQAPWAEGSILKRPVDQPAVDFIMAQLRRYPGEITLVPIGPLVNIADLFRQYSEAKSLIWEIILMGGSVDIGYNGKPSPDKEWNIVADVESARTVFTSGVPITMVGLDATGTLRLEAENRAALFAHGSLLTDALAALYKLWGSETPVLFDPMAVAYAIRPELCAVQEMHIEVDHEGYTRAIPGKSPNVKACTVSDSEAFFRFYLERLLSHSL
ncbi:MAG: nucleoside hydrolase [Armatimonadetes bacterium]|nr:nucleoside hydrolase [Armatimonadota bacterium]